MILPRQRYLPADPVAVDDSSLAQPTTLAEQAQQCVFHGDLDSCSKGIVAGLVVGFVLICFVIWWFTCRRKRRAEEDGERERTKLAAQQDDEKKRRDADELKELERVQRIKLDQGAVETKRDLRILELQEKVAKG